MAAESAEEPPMPTEEQHQDQQPEPPAPGRLLRLLSRFFVWVIVSLLLVYLLAAGSAVFFWQGWEDVELRFAVVDAETGSPINGAVITAFCPGYEDWIAPVTAGTAPGGTAGMVIRCKSSGKATMFSRTGAVYLGWWAFRVSKEEYDTGKWMWLSKYTGEGHKLDDLTLPTIRIKLKKEQPGRK
jgi:hypothetical protein